MFTLACVVEKRTVSPVVQGWEKSVSPGSAWKRKREQGQSGILMDLVNSRALGQSSSISVEPGGFSEAEFSVNHLNSWGSLTTKKQESDSGQILHFTHKAFLCSAYMVRSQHTPCIKFITLNQRVSLLQPCSLVAQHVAGKDHVLTDVLSCMPRSLHNSQYLVSLHHTWVFPSCGVGLRSTCNIMKTEALYLLDQHFIGFESHCLYFNIMLVASMDGNNFVHVMNKEKSRDQDGLSQASTRSVCKTKFFPVLI